MTPMPAVADTVGAQRCGANEDRALYRCECGRDFHAAVSTTVACPGCGGGQDW
jgi:Zn finger protein HypA/HybF involved in hydrogenase expression